MTNRIQTKIRLTQDGVDTSIEFRVVGNLSVFYITRPFLASATGVSLRQQPNTDRVLTRPDDLSSGSDHTQLADVDLDDGTLGHHSQLRVKGRLRVLLYSDDGELEGGFQVGCKVQIG
jgi:hypothetical protein